MDNQMPRMGGLEATRLIEASALIPGSCWSEGVRQYLVEQLAESLG